MFYSDRIVSIQKSDKILEIGPGASPDPRSDILLELNLPEKELAAQRGYAKMQPIKQKIVYYDGGKFPFKNDEFDYVICAHVLEHVDNIEQFYKELQRVAKKGYLEFPTIYYDYLYNFDVHLNLLRYDDTVNKIYFSKKPDALHIFKPVQALFYESLTKGYTDLVDDLQRYMFQGFEWSRENAPKLTNTKDIKQLILKDITLPLKDRSAPIASSTPEKATQQSTLPARPSLRKVIRKVKKGFLS